jgi:hypothetical protein
MNKMISVVLFLMGLLCISHAEAMGFEITKVLPDKLLYDTGDQVSVVVTVNNLTATTQQGELHTRLEWEMDEGVPLGNQPVELKPKEEKTFTFTWKKSTQVLGRTRNCCRTGRSSPKVTIFSMSSIQRMPCA